MTLRKTLTIAGLGLLLGLGATVGANAAPLKAPVHRMERINHRITHAALTGKITPAKAAMLHAAVRTARHQEMARHGRLTVREARHLRHEETGLSRKI